MNNSVYKLHIFVRRASRLPPRHAAARALSCRSLTEFFFSPAPPPLQATPSRDEWDELGILFISDRHTLCQLTVFLFRTLSYFPLGLLNFVSDRVPLCRAKQTSAVINLIHFNASLDNLLTSVALKRLSLSKCNPMWLQKPLQTSAFHNDQLHCSTTA